MADNIYYREAWIKTVIKDGALSCPFPVYASRAFLDGVQIDVTKHEGETVLACIDYMIDHQVMHKDDTSLVMSSGLVVENPTDDKDYPIPVEDEYVGV